MAPLNEESVQEIAVEEQEVELTPEQKEAQLSQLMSDGRRELMGGNFEGSSQKFGEAAEFAAKHYGTFAVESFEPNFMYGRTLVELGGVENDLFQSALVNIAKKDGDEAEKDGDESMTEEEKEDVRELVAEALTENAKELEKKENEGTEEESKDEEMKEEKESADEAAGGDKKEEDEKAESEEAADNEEKEEETVDGEKNDGEADEKEDIEDGDEEDEEEEEELDTNQLAWEALEVASKIADKMIAETGDVQWKRKRADVFIQLAQSSANDEKYDVAMLDLGNARDLMAEIATEGGDRLTAEIYFHEGRINRLRNEFGLAEESFNKGVDVFQKILAALKTASGDSPTEEQTNEMKDVEELIKDFKERAEDCNGSEAQKKMMVKMAEKEKAETPSVLTSSNAKSDPTANDITSLIRKKRAHDESEVEGAPKKAKSDEEEVGEENVAV